MKIGYFLEDIAHERFLRAMVERVAVERGVPQDSIEHDVRNAAHGVGAVVSSFKRFLSQYGKGKESAFDLIYSLLRWMVTV